MGYLRKIRKITISVQYGVIVNLKYFTALKSYINITYLCLNTTVRNTFSSNFSCQRFNPYAVQVNGNNVARDRVCRVEWSMISRP